MQVNRFVSKSTSFFPLALVIYLATGLFLLQYYQYQLNGDGISYISIARKYLNGHFSDAINGYWGPLLSWLLIPFLSLKLPPVFAVKLMLLLVGLPTLIGIRSLSQRFDMSNAMRTILLFSLIPILLRFALLGITPDSIMLCVLVYYLAIIFDTNYNESKNKGAVCGTLGALAYLTKGYGFPFFLCHFLVFNVLHYVRSETTKVRKTVLMNFLFGLGVFLTISGSWIFLMSNKYGNITISKAGSYNFALMGPKTGGLHGHPMFHRLLEPPNNTAISAWEDPSYIKLEAWNPVQSVDAFRYFTKLVKSNLGTASARQNPHGGRGLLWVLNSFSVLSIPILLTSLVICLPFKRMKLPTEIWYSLVTLTIYISGYIFVFVVERYIWIACILVILMGFCLFNYIIVKTSFSNTTKRLIFITFLTFFVASVWITPIKTLANGAYVGKNDDELSRKLQKYNIRDNIAANWRYRKTLILSFHNNYTYYGVTGPITDEKLETELRQYEIDYYFLWQPPDKLRIDKYDEYMHGVSFLSKYKEIVRLDNLTVYSLKELQYSINYM
ncbi:hypothetical protein GWO43_06915 [candidate division KSB1 bacterium]|nr:hypothetical protein [candidate division KSB1 bacterium]NIV70709.1 hypothetical protein [Phycisphaerae bacterium]NIR72674.1 hypothetical protein [candidate division KSB1 bacterium]NIS23696.1 hypothetical protein [candidate division KSB1 bacterium]NIT70616.1 hypothetical protein [candidate division KSB1 bacterium]